MSFRQVLTVLRRRYRLILAMTLVGAAVGLFLASREPPKYYASAMLRFAGERRALTGDDQEAPGTEQDDRPDDVDPPARPEPDGRRRRGR